VWGFESPLRHQYLDDATPGPNQYFSVAN
jgi:hypothetical protein